MRAAVIEDGVVVNVIEVESESESEDWVLCPDEVGIGWGYDGETWTPAFDPYADPNAEFPAPPQQAISASAPKKRK